MSDQVHQKEPIQQPASFPATLLAEQIPQEVSLAVDSTAETSSTPARPISTSTEAQIKVYNPVESTAKADEELDDAFFEPTVNDVRAIYASVSSRSKRLNDAPLITSKYRDAEKGEREKAKRDKWPEFSDGTIIQSVFPSSSPIQPVYGFVRSCLDEASRTKTFILWQPPRNRYPEHPIPVSKKPNPYKTNIITPANYGAVRGGVVQGLQGGTGGQESLAELGLVPQSLLMIKWDEEEMNSSSFSAPLKDELRKKSEPLPLPAVKETSEIGTPVTATAPDEARKKKIPKWLQEGLLKKK
ncbi:hypothetical protein I307_02379 [Cryptococcus deuterogattii 99/473]|uniref:UBX domain-containing protein n=1 Tax=Cryptococcus deuterogattii Ram5 TaxID=1296110 RepID=A0A0D0USW3_9TREE|nr:hypothetical protein I309_02020 [Cryptococcus deuterogattii LA55]KIR34831.1 hypothetical protein I352_03083 [Cryptococcus deuterogattii MMRL2647]KIR38291.1 hypothetical protein I313_05864 [Cryptococcus deuterogattii Ram5]KIR73571.1 hypothetical protein I310_02243 [Cryptococcus deuterogattii CA1014]KIR93060.1 hypothetical protein I304_02723 [Cryptococcus deuterogattii CBS 10090]KIR99676.1 hypothetical protein L804_03308 [Cryptococcus deuterogattii 2001/935-1]KIY58131.1 hypothetical protein 